MTIRRTITIMNLAIVAAMAVTGGVFYFLANSITQLEKTAVNLHTTEMLASELRESSRQLTLRVREFVITGDPASEKRFQHIRDVRDGRVPRETTLLAAPGEQIPLLELVRRQGMPEEERRLLEEAKRHSDLLAVRETEAMQAARGMFKDASGAYVVRGEPDPELAKRLVFGPEYLAGVEGVMRPLDAFLELLNSRIQTTLAQHETRVHTLLRCVCLALVCICLSALLSMWYGHRWLILPLERTRMFAARVADGDFQTEIPIGREDEIGALRRALNAMVGHLRARLSELEKAEQLVRHNEQEARRARRQAVEALREAQKAARVKSDFLGRMSHEIRTPMNAIIGMSYLCLQTDLNSRQRDYVEKVQEAGNELLGLINDVLDFSRMEAGNMQITRAPFRISALMDNLNDVMMFKARDKGLEMLFFVGKNVPDCIEGDARHLSQILANLMSNAVKFTDDGEIVVSVHRIEDAGTDVRLRFTVCDTGVGMDEKQVRALFESFNQADASITRRHGGAGLGLAIAGHLVELMGGIIEVNSAPGQGSSFAFELSFGTCAEPLTELSPRTLRLGDVRCLVVDDSVVARRIFCEMVDSFGASHQSVASGEAALEAVAATREDTPPFDLVILDWKMPGLDGIATARRIRDMTTLERQPGIVLVSACDMEVMSCHCDGIDNIRLLSKPVSPTSLFDTLSELLGRRGTQGAPSPGVESVPCRDDIRGRHVLLVEDNDINQQIARELLERVGVEVTVASNGAEAVGIVLEQDFSLVLMDVQMPVMDGLEATRRIREAGKSRRVLPIVAMTAHATTMDREHSLRAGMNDHLTKPINPDELYAALVRWICPAKGVRPAVPAPKPEAGSYGPEEVAEPAFLGDVQGLDVRAGLANVAQNRELYLELLCRFADRYSSTAQELKELLDDEGREEALRLAHTVKGVAANLGALDLAAASQRLEQGIRRNGPLAPLLEAYAAHMQVVLDNVNSMVPPCHTAAPAGGQSVLLSDTDRRRMVRLLDNAPRRMEVDWGKVRDELASCLHLMEQSDMEEDFRGVLRALDDFDTELVERRAQLLLRKLQHS